MKPLKIAGRVIPHDTIDRVAALMRGNEVFSAMDLESWFIACGFSDYAYTAAERLIQRERKAGRLRKVRRLQWKMIGGVGGEGNNNTAAVGIIDSLWGKAD